MQSWHSMRRSAAQSSHGYQLHTHSPRAYNRTCENAIRLDTGSLHSQDETTDDERRRRIHATRLGRVWYTLKSEHRRKLRIGCLVSTQRREGTIGKPRWSSPPSIQWRTPSPRRDESNLRRRTITMPVESMDASFVTTTKGNASSRTWDRGVAAAANHSSSLWSRRHHAGQKLPVDQIRQRLQT